MGKHPISCRFNLDTGCVEARFQDGSTLAVYCEGVEDEYANNRFQRSALDDLVYNHPVEYLNLVLNGDPAAYLQVATDYSPLD